MIDFPAGQGGPSHGGPETPLEARVTRLEYAVGKILERLANLARDVAVIKATMATKVDIANLRTELKTEILEAKNATILWVMSAVFLAQALPLIAKWLERYF